MLHSVSLITSPYFFMHFSHHYWLQSILYHVPNLAIFQSLESWGTWRTFVFLASHDKSCSFLPPHPSYFTEDP